MTGTKCKDTRASHLILTLSCSIVNAWFIQENMLSVLATLLRLESLLFARLVQKAPATGRSKRFTTFEPRDAHRCVNQGKRSTYYLSAGPAISLASWQNLHEQCVTCQKQVTKSNIHSRFTHSRTNHKYYGRVCACNWARMSNIKQVISALFILWQYAWCIQCTASCASIPSPVT